MTHGVSGVHRAGFDVAGSGPAQLALAILYAVTSDEELSQQLYQRFKFDCIARFNMDEDFQMTTDFVQQWIEKEMGGLPEQGALLI